MSLEVFDGDASNPITPPGPASTPLTLGDIGVLVAPISAAVQTFIFQQSSPSSTWNIQHNLGRFPSVTVVDSGNDQVEGDVVYINSNRLTVSFSAPFSGEAYLN